MYRPVSILALFLIALFIATGCDTVEPRPDAQNDSLSDALPADEQVDLSLISDDVQQMLLRSASLTEESLNKHGMQLHGAVFTLSDDPTANEVWAFERASDGRLTPAGTYSTGGQGSGDGLNGTSNPMALAYGNRLLYVVNGGSDQISLFRVDGASLTLLGTFSSAGPRPISITTKRGVTYVLNAGRPEQPGNITGFRLGDAGGRLGLIPLGSQLLNEGAGSPSQIDFNPPGTLLAITDKPTNTITTYPVHSDGSPGTPTTHPSNGQTPFGFDFDRRGNLFVSEAFGGAPDASAVSSYDVRGDGALTLLAASVPTTETAACWVEIFGEYAYTTNTGSSSITGYRIGRNGSLTRLDEDGVTFFTGEGSRPLDMDIALRYLYTHSAGTNRIGVYRIGEDGGLTSVSDGAATGLPATAVGVAAY